MPGLEQYANNASTTITGALSISQVNITVSANDGFPAVTTASLNWFYVLIDQELFKVTDNSSLVWIVERGNQSTIAATHAASANVYCVLTKQSLADIQISASAGGTSTKFLTYTELLALSSPKDGDCVLVNDSGYTAVRKASAWVYQWPGLGQATLPPNVASLTWVNQSTATANSTHGYLNMNETASGVSSPNMRCLVKTLAASSNYTFDIAFTTFWRDFSNGCGIILRESSTGKMIKWFARGYRVLSLEKMNSATSFNTVYGSGDSKNWSGQVCFRVIDDGTNYNWYYGSSFDTMAIFDTRSRTDFLTANQIGVFVESPIIPGGANFVHWKEY